MRRTEMRGRAHASAFADAEVARRYRHRPGYAPEAIAFLATLVTPAGSPVLDLGSGTGNVARPLAALVARVDALDPSAEMIAEGRRLPGGDDPRIRWSRGAAESAPLDGPYGLATAGSSLHWLDPEIVFPRVASALSPGAPLAILRVADQIERANDRLGEILRRYSVYGDAFKRPNAVGELVERGLFEKVGEREFPELVRQPIADYVSGFHSMSSFAVARIGSERAAAFDDEVRRAVPLDEAGAVSRVCTTAVVWGRILS